MSHESDRPANARRAFRLPRGGAQVDAQVDDELQFHLEERIEELVAQGLTREQAEAEARRRFGDVARWRKEAAAIDRDQVRDERRADVLDTLRRETRQAARALVRAPGFSLVALLTLALGLGAATAIFAVLDAVVLRPLPYPAADRLVWIDHQVPLVGANDRWGLATVNYFDFREHVPALAAIGIWSDAPVTMTVPDGSPERVRGAEVSASIFQALGARPALGRLLADYDNAPGASGVVVLGHGYWERRFAGDSTVIGRKITLEGAPVEVVGVASEGLQLPQQQLDVWLPMTLDPAQRVNQHTYAALGRLRDGATPELLRSQLVDRERRFSELYPGVYSPDFFTSTGFSPAVTSLHEHVVGELVTRTLWVMFAAVGLVLLVACAHVANLFLVRLEARRRETAVRTALGAARGQLAWRSLTESLLLTLGAAALGIALAFGALRALVALAPPSLPRLAEIGLGWPHVAFIVGLAALVGVVFGILPLLRGSVDLGVLRDESRGMTASRHRNAVRAALVVGQVALSVVLLAAGGLMLRSAARLHAVPPGFDAEHVLTFQVPLPYSRYQWADYDKVLELHRTLARRLAATPGVLAVGGTVSLPMDGRIGCALIGFEERGPDGSNRGACLSYTTVAPGYFETMRIPVVRGHAPTWDEVASGTAGVVVTRSFAEHFWPGQDPLGKGLKGYSNLGEPPYFRVVGVVDDVRMEGLAKPPTEVIFFPMKPGPELQLWGAPHALAVTVRTSTGDASTVLAAARAAMAQLDPAVPIDNVRWMERIVATSLSQTTLAMLLLAIAAGMALLLSAVGIYGVIAYIVGQRRGEIGIRLALGAPAAMVGRDVVLGALRLAVVGIVIGLAGAVATTRVLQSLLYDVSPTDPWTLVAVAALLLALAALASWVPARRAARVPPMEALRTS
ncbi:MAG TPA: ABC transporter permease [Gemmatimonadaceae bacterium]|nr:ABC transporter permease [Gemmatimonadaceae bacterium]